MSLNFCEQRIYEHLGSRPEEKRHWQAKVRSAAAAGVPGEAAARLERELWRYLEELSSTTEPFRSEKQLYHLRRTSMRNLAELLLRLWVDPKMRRGPAGVE